MRYLLNRVIGLENRPPDPEPGQAVEDAGDGCALERPQIGAWREDSGPHLGTRGDEIRDQSTPPRAIGWFQRCDAITDRLAISEEGEVETAGGAEREPSPRPDVDVEELVLSVAPIALELDLDQSGEPHRRHQARRGIEQPWDLDGFDEATAETEVDRILAAPARGHRADERAVTAEGGHRVLALTRPRNELLQHQLTRRDGSGERVEG